MKKTRKRRQFWGKNKKEKIKTKNKEKNTWEKLKLNSQPAQY
jgi:hypothetical protein